MTCIRFSVPGEPVGKARPRFTKSGHAYTPAKTRVYESIVKGEASIAMRWKKQLTGAISLSVRAFFPIPKYFTRSIREKALSGELYHQKKPDWDNVGKIISDALNGVVYADDAIVARAEVVKLYSDNPRVEICVKQLTEEKERE